MMILDFKNIETRVSKWKTFYETEESNSINLKKLKKYNFKKR